MFPKTNEALLGFTSNYLIVLMNINLKTATFRYFLNI